VNGTATPYNDAVQRTVTAPLMRASRPVGGCAVPAADGERWADEKHREGERLERGAASQSVTRVGDARVSGAGSTTLAPGRCAPPPVAMQHSGPVACGTIRSAGACTQQLGSQHSVGLGGS
jgi:hypothetical protein